MSSVYMYFVEVFNAAVVSTELYFYNVLPIVVVSFVRNVDSIKKSMRQNVNISFCATFINILESNINKMLPVSFWVENDKKKPKQQSWNARTYLWYLGKTTFRCVPHTNIDKTISSWKTSHWIAFLPCSSY